MKAIASFLLVTAALEAAVVASGYSLDAASGLAILFAAGTASGFVADYSRPARSKLVPVRKPALAPARPVNATIYETAIIFNTRVA